MKIEFVGRNYTPSDKLKSIVEKKISKMEKFFDKPLKAKVVCTKNKDREKMEINLNSGSLFIRSEVETDNMYANLDICMSKIEKQIIKYSDKKDPKKQKPLTDFEFFDEMPKLEFPKITKRKVYALSPMTEKEALVQMDMVGNDFFVFMNSEKGRVCVLYKRADGDIGFIETV